MASVAARVEALDEGIRVTFPSAGTAIAENIRDMFSLRVPIITVIIGEGGSAWASKDGATWLRQDLGAEGGASASFIGGGRVSGGGEAAGDVAPGPQSTAGEEVSGNAVTAVADRISGFTGRYVAYWSLIAPFIYSYEVVARYFFNSPTNWAHESMFLMFGMQYLIAGAYAMLTESHVRVDIFYAPLPRKKKAWTDLVTSIFFFIFAFTLLWTSYTFAMDALAVPTGNALVSDWARGEVSFLEVLSGWNVDQWRDPNVRWGEISFNEWEVPLWPMKWVMVLGGLLLVLQGVSKVMKDIDTLRRGVGAERPRGTAEQIREAN